MAEYTHDVITRDHFTGFGMIINTAADIDGTLDLMIAGLVRGRIEYVAPITTFLGAKDKRDYLVAMMSSSKSPPYVIKGFEKLMDRVRTAMDLRNTVAHRGWTKGRRAGTIKPIVISARTTVKVLGTELNEKEWTAGELIAQALVNQELGKDLMTFAGRYGLIPPEYYEHMALRRAGKKAAKSASEGG